ncbi:MAG: Ada metal-binding domain-containing protein [Pseudomonadota bacterium]|nr:Ada metal-binding domain-containing protein [Pseudomonadota bacterium]
MKYIGNNKSKELHLEYCPWAQLMNEEHIRLFDSLDDAIAAGYDPCGHCQPFTWEGEEARGAAKFTASFNVHYHGAPADWDTQIHRGETIELNAEIKPVSGSQSSLEGKTVKFAIVYHAGSEYPLGTVITGTDGRASLTHTFPENISTCTVHLVAHFDSDVEPDKIERYAAMYDMVSEADFHPKQPTDDNTDITFRLDSPMNGEVKIYRRFFLIFWLHKRTISWSFKEKGPAHVIWNGRNAEGKKTWGIFKAVIEADTWPLSGFDKVELRRIKRKR